MAVKDPATTAAFMPRWFLLDMLGSCMYVLRCLKKALSFNSKSLIRSFPRPLIRFPLALRLVSAMAFVVIFMAIASPHGFAARVRSRRNAGKSSWKRAVSEIEVAMPVSRTVCETSFFVLLGKDILHTL